MKKITRYPIRIAGSQKGAAYTLLLAHEEAEDFSLFQEGTFYAGQAACENPYGSYLVELSLEADTGEALYENTNVLTELVFTQIKEYMRGERQDFDFPILLQGTAFQIKVWRELCKIPYGETRSYKQIAEAVGNPKACRAVGGANNKNPISIAVPCHRVIGANGNLVGYGLGLDVKRILLELEAGSKNRCSENLAEQTTR